MPFINAKRLNPTQPGYYDSSVFGEIRFPGSHSKSKVIWHEIFNRKFN